MLRLLIAGLLLAASSASAQTNPVTISPDDQFAIVQKDVGAERWAIVQDRNNRTITGNVFSPAGGPAQFVWCESIGNSNYRCSGSGGCAQQPCSWASIATVTLPDSFFAVPGGQPTPRPSSVPTPRPTNPPSTGLQGLIGTWDFTYRIISQFTDTLRLQRLDDIDGIPIIVGVNEFGGTIVGGKTDDVFPENQSPYEWAVVDLGVIICQAYIFDRTGDSATGRYYLADRTGDECGSFRGAYLMSGVRTSRTASATSEPKSLERKADRRLRRLRAIEDRDVRRTHGIEAPQSFHELGHLPSGLSRRQ